MMAQHRTLNAGLVALWFFKGSGPGLLRNPTYYYDFSGGGGSGPPPPLDPRMLKMLVYCTVSICFPVKLQHSSWTHYFHLEWKAVWILVNSLILRIVSNYSPWYRNEVILILHLSHDVASGSEILPCNKIDKPLVVKVAFHLIFMRCVHALFGEKLIVGRKFEWIISLVIYLCFIKSW